MENIAQHARRRSTGRTVGASIVTVIAVICALAFIGQFGASSDATASGSVDIVPAILAAAFGAWAAYLWRGKK